MDIPKLPSEESKDNDEKKLNQKKINESNSESPLEKDLKTKKSLGLINNNNISNALAKATKNDFNINKQDDLQKEIEKENEKIEVFLKSLPNYNFMFT